MSHFCAECGVQTTRACSRCKEVLCGEKCAIASWKSDSKSQHRNRCAQKSDAPVGNLFTEFMSMLTLNRAPGFPLNDETVILPTKTTLFHGSINDFSYGEMKRWSWFGSSMRSPASMIFVRTKKRMDAEQANRIEDAGFTQVFDPRIMECETTRPMQLTVLRERDPMNYRDEADCDAVFVDGIGGDGAVHPSDPARAGARDVEDELRFRFKPGDVLDGVRLYRLNVPWTRAMAPVVAAHPQFWARHVEPHGLIDRQNGLEVRPYVDNRVVEYALVRQFARDDAPAALRAIIAIGALIRTASGGDAVMVVDNRTPPGYDAMPGTTILDAALRPPPAVIGQRALGAASWITRNKTPLGDNVPELRPHIIVFGLGVVKKSERRERRSQARAMLRETVARQLERRLRERSRAHPGRVTRILCPKKVAEHVERLGFAVNRNERADPVADLRLFDVVFQ